MLGFLGGAGGNAVCLFVLNRRVVISCSNEQYKSRVLGVPGCHAVFSLQNLHNYFTLVFISLNHDIIVYRIVHWHNPDLLFKLLRQQI